MKTNTTVMRANLPILNMKFFFSLENFKNIIHL